MKKATTTAKATKKTAKAEKAKGQKYRVYYMPAKVKEGLSLARETHGVTNAGLLSLAVTRALPALRERLVALGLTKNGKRRPVRLPVTPEILNPLRDVAAETNVPANTLLTLCLLSLGTKRAK